jgi:hypothetical protein
MSLVAMVTLAASWQLFGISSALNQKGFAALSYHGSGAPGDFYAQLSPEWRAAEWVRGRRSQEKALLVGLDGNLFWTTPVMVDGPYDNKSIVAVARESKSSAEMADRLKKSGIQLLVIDSARAERLDRQFGYMGWDAPTRARVREFFATQVVRRYQDGSLQIGEIR